MREAADLDLLSERGPAVFGDQLVEQRFQRDAVQRVVGLFHDQGRVFVSVEA